MPLYKIVLINLFIIFLFSKVSAQILENCKWNNFNGTPCVTVSKTPNSSDYNEIGINKKIITKQEIIESGAIDTNDIFKLIPGLDVFQSGQRGQQTSIFTRGSESNHTLVLLNGIAINDQSTTDGLHDFGQDFVQTIQQIEIYKGPSGAHFGPSAIAGAINFITDVDYSNSYSLSGFDKRNNSISGNHTKITKNGWHLNLKGALNQSRTDSAIAKGNEEDETKNYQLNIDSKKWINDNLKINSTLYSRRTLSDYDGSATNEIGYISDNKMYALQSGLEYKTKNSNNNITLHYHNYDRNYENGGYLDEYYSEALNLKLESKIIANEKLSFGYGGEYKYDWGSFENRGSYTASTKGHVKDLAVFTNAGYKFTEKQILSIYTRADDHKTTGSNQNYKINFTQIFEDFKLGLTHSTGLRNPSLYELYGSDNYGISGNIHLKPEKSKTNEISAEYNISKKLKFNSSAYRTTIYDRIETNSAYSKHENKTTDLNQEGIENELFFKGIDKSFSIFANFTKSRKVSGGHKSRRPDLTYGSNFSKKFLFKNYGPFNLNLNYKFTDRYLDWDGSANTFQKSTNLIDLSIKKNWLGNSISFNITNLLNERYEKPATYSQDGRQFRFNFTKTY
jgi:vitamin B12 transporter